MSLSDESIAEELTVTLRGKDLSSLCLEVEYSLEFDFSASLCGPASGGSANGKGRPTELDWDDMMDSDDEVGLRSLDIHTLSVAPSGASADMAFLVLRSGAAGHGPP